MSKGMTIALGAILAAALVVSPAHATLLAPGGSVTAPNATFGSLPYAGGTVLASVVNETPYLSVLLTGTLTTEVIRETGGTLDFLYQVTADPSNGDNIHRITVTGFTGVTTDVQFGTATSPFVAPTSLAMSSADRSSDGSTIGFQLAPAGSAGGLAPGTTSYVLIVKTDATAFTTGTTSGIDGGIVDWASFAPVAVPEPSSLMLAGIGALCFVGYGLRRRKALGA
jgi:hypothetical protein